MASEWEHLMHNAEENRNLHKSEDDQNQSRRSQFLQHGGGQRKRNGADTVPYGYGRKPLDGNTIRRAESSMS